MTDSPSARIYRRLLRLYPRRFRDEYGADMALLFAEQLRDEPATRVLVRGLIDLAISVPTQHLEAHMNRPPNRTVPLLFAAIGITGIVSALIGGSNLAVIAFGLAVAVVAGGLTIAAWRHTRTIAASNGATAQWWKVLLAGVGVLTAAIVVLNVVGHLGDNLWLAMMLTLIAGIVATVTGLLLGVAHIVERGPRHAPG